MEERKIRIKTCYDTTGIYVTEYNEKGDIVRDLGSDGLVCAITYNDKGKILKKVRNNGTVVEYLYNKYGLLKTITDPLFGRITHYKYDKYGEDEPGLFDMTKEVIETQINLGSEGITNTSSPSNIGVKPTITTTRKLYNSYGRIMETTTNPYNDDDEFKIIKYKYDDINGNHDRLMEKHIQHKRQDHTIFDTTLYLYDDKGLLYRAQVIEFKIMDDTTEEIVLNDYYRIYRYNNNNKKISCECNGTIESTKYYEYNEYGHIILAHTSLVPRYPVKFKRVKESKIYYSYIYY